VFVADGDSITEGFGAATPYTAHVSLTGRWDVINVAIPGMTVATALVNAPTAVDPSFFPGVTNVDVAWLGTNDIANNGTTPDATYAMLTSYVAARHAKGWTVILPTMISREGFDTQKNAYNALILANTAGADAIVDFTGTQLGCDGCWADSLFQADGVHPNETGITTVEAPIIGTAVNAIPHALN
jgi:lysophospholipase L1-like esterase